MDKILFFDIDGTLYDDNKTLPNSAKEAISQAKAKGHEIAISTGRAPFMIKPVLEELEIDTYICFNGQYVVHGGEVIHAGEIQKSLLEEVTEFANERSHPLVYMDDQQMISTVEGHPHIEEGIFSLKFPYPEVDKYFYRNRPVYQTLLFCTEEEEAAYAEAFPRLKFVRWHTYSCDILPAGGSKAEGMEKLLSRLGKTMDDAVAFGDGLNDIEMLEAAGTGVAMGNSLPEVKKYADYVTGHVNTGGLADAMRKLKLI